MLETDPVQSSELHFAAVSCFSRLVLELFLLLLLSAPDQSPPAPSASCFDLRLDDNKNKHTPQDPSREGLTWHLQQKALYFSNVRLMTKKTSDPKISHFLHGVWFSASLGLARI